MHHHFLGPVAALAVMTLGLPPLAAAQALDHRSAFADYKPYQDISPGDWRSLNHIVGAAALKPPAGAAAAPVPAPAAAASTPITKMPMQPMQGHHHPMHGGTR